MILQDMHVHLQRQFYDEHKDQLITLYTWSKIPLDYHKRLYLLFLFERFDKDSMPEWAVDWLEAAKEFAEKQFPICTICGVHSLGEMCGGEEWKEAIYFSFEYH